MIKRIIDIRIGIDYKDNENKTEITYKNKNKRNYGDFQDIDFKDVNLKITRNNMLLLFFHSAKNSVFEDITSMIKFDII